MKLAVEDRFHEKYIPEPNTGCWLWTDHTDRDGYGSITIERKNKKAHRLSYEIFFGKIPDELSICHKCDTPECVNPSHLFAGTAKDNNRDCISKGRFKKAPGFKSGEQNPNSKLTEKITNLIRLKYGKTSAKELANEFGISKGHIHKIIRNEIWKIKA